MTEQTIQQQLIKILEDAHMLHLVGERHGSGFQIPRGDQPLFMAKPDSPLHKSNADCYGLDSLDRVEFAMGVDEMFGFDTPDDHVVRYFTTLDSTAAYIAARKEA